MNESMDFAGLRIHGLLTDFSQFLFYSYDPTTRQFCFDECIIINVKRTDVLSDMIDGGRFFPWEELRADV